MQFLADQDIYGVTIQFLRDSGHDLVTAAELGMSKAKDFQLLRAAHDQGRIFVTRDRDFGALVFVQASGPGSSTGSASENLADGSRHSFRPPSQTRRSNATRGPRWPCVIVFGTMLEV